LLQVEQDLEPEPMEDNDGDANDSVPTSAVIQPVLGLVVAD
jgi:hypothetical protein